MNRRALLIGILAIVGGAAALLGWIIFLRGPAAPEIVPIETTPDLSGTGALPTTTPTTQPGTTPTGTTPETVTTPEPIKTDDSILVLGIASSFAERYGSYSNQTDFANLLDLRVQMTKAFAAKTDAYVAAQRKTPTTTYSGATTNAIRPEVVQFDESAGTAEIKVLVQREYLTAANLAGKVSYETVSLSMVLVDGAWKVDSITTLK